MTMNLELRYRLWRLSRMANPSGAFEKRLSAELREKTGHSLWWMPIGRIAAGVASLTLAVSGGTAVYAYTSDTVTPEHPLYMVRQTLERAEVSASFTAARRELVLRKNQARHERQLNTVRSRTK